MRVNKARAVCPFVLQLVLILMAIPPNASSIEIVAHRGASHDAPENTLPAVLLGWERGADAVEVDIHQTADGTVVAIHDKDIMRVTGKPGLVAELKFDRLQLLDAGAWKGSEWKGTQIPTLGAVLDTVPSDKSLVVEIKCPMSVLEELEVVLDRSGKRGQVMLIAFDYDTITEAKRRMPDIPCYWLYGFSEREADRYGVRTPDDLIERVQAAGLQGLDVRHDGVWVPELARSLRAIGKKLYVYTVNSVESARWLQGLGVSGITTDRPGFLREALTGK